MTTLVDSFRTTLRGYLTYRGREGHLAFLLHRLTGLGTLLFLIIHIVDTSFVYFAPHLYGETIALYQSTPFMIGEIFLVFSVIFHGVNGLRIAVVDMWLPHKWTLTAQKNWTRWAVVITIVLWLPAAVIMFRSMLIYNFGFGG